MQSIDYDILSFEPQENPTSIKNITSTLKDTYWETSLAQASITIKFKKCKIQDISLCLSNSVRLTITVYNEPDQSDSKIILECEETVYKPKAINYNSGLLREAKHKEFSYGRLDISSIIENESIKIYYWIMKTNRENQSSPIRNIHPPADPKAFYHSPQKYPTSKFEASKKRKLGSDSFIVSSAKNYDLSRSNLKLLKNESKTVSIEDGKTVSEQNKIFEDIQNRKKRVLRSQTAKKEPVNSYRCILNSRIISCSIEDEELLTTVIELCDVLGAIYLEKLESSVSYLISDG